jgi:hypothetical protein
MKSTALLICSFILAGTCCFAQSKKEIKANKIKNTTEYTTETISGKEVTYKSTYSVFDIKSGETLEKTEFGPDGSVKKKSTAKFDGKGNKIEETDYEVKEDKKPDDNSNLAKNTKTLSKFNSSNDKIEELVYDANGKLLKKTKTDYNANGDKILEVRFDGDSKLLKKEVYTYDSKKGLRIEHKTYDGNNVLLEGKKFVYGY